MKLDKELEKFKNAILNRILFNVQRSQKDSGIEKIYLDMADNFTERQGIFLCELDTWEGDIAASAFNEANIYKDGISRDELYDSLINQVFINLKKTI